MSERRVVAIAGRVIVVLCTALGFVAGALVAAAITGAFGLSSDEAGGFDLLALTGGTLGGCWLGIEASRRWLRS